VHACATDPSDASGTLLYDVLADRWFYELLDELGLRHELLPVSRRSCDVAGHLLPTASTALRLVPLCWQRLPRESISPH
jgi:xylulokinase